MSDKVKMDVPAFGSFSAFFQMSGHRQIPSMLSAAQPE